MKIKSTEKRKSTCLPGDPKTVRFDSRKDFIILKNEKRIKTKLSSAGKEYCYTVIENIVKGQLVFEDND